MTSPSSDPSPRANVLRPPLDEYQRQLEALKEAGPELVADLTDAQFHWAPAVKTWSIAQCFNHLRTTAELYVPCIEEGIGKARSRGWTGDGRARWGPLERWFIHLLEPPPRRRLIAPSSFQPIAAGSLEEELVDFLRIKDRYIALLHEANGLDLYRARMRSPVSSLLRMRLGAGLALVAAHERRHLWQARQIRKAPGFPTS